MRWCGGEVVPACNTFGSTFGNNAFFVKDSTEFDEDRLAEV